MSARMFSPSEPGGVFMSGSFATAEIIAERPVQSERQKSFDVLASIHMLRFDLQWNGEISPGTRERVYDEELSLLVEGVDRAARTSFVLEQRDGDLMYYKNGQAHSYTGMLLTGRDVAAQEAARDCRKQFLADDAVRDLYVGYQMRALSPGQSFVWASPYRYDVEAQYGEHFMRAECGRFPDRKMAFLYRAYATEDGHVVLESQTIDRSDDKALAAAIEAGQQGADMDNMVDINDVVMAEKFGNRYYAGRLGAEVRENAWDILQQQRDLIDYYMNGLENLARSDLYGDTLDQAVKKHTYGVWAAFKSRLDRRGGSVPMAEHDMSRQTGFSLGARPTVEAAAFYRSAQDAAVAHEVSAAFQRFSREGIMMVGCGGSISIARGEDALFAADPDDVFSGTFGKKKEADDDCEFISKECPMCHAKNVRTKSTKTSISGSCGCYKAK